MERNFELPPAVRFGDCLAAYCSALRHYDRQGEGMLKAKDWTDIVRKIENHDEKIIAAIRKGAERVAGHTEGADPHKDCADKDRIYNEALWICKKYAWRNNLVHNGCARLVSAGQQDKAKKILDEVEKELRTVVTEKGIENVGEMYATREKHPLLCRHRSLPNENSCRWLGQRISHGQEEAQKKPY